MDYTLVKAILASNDKKVSLEDATKIYYSSILPTLLSDDETGLYGDSPQYIYSLLK